MEIALFLINLIASLVLGSVMIYFPGRLVIRLSHVTTSPLENFLMALVAGTGTLTLFHWFLFTFHFGWLLWPIGLGLSGLEIWFNYKENKIKATKLPDPDAPPVRSLKSYWPLLVLGCVLVIFQGRFIMTSGWPSAEGMSFLAWHGIDAPWHIYNIVQFARKAPVHMTGFAGEALTNYHAFSDMFVGAFRQLLPLDPWHLYFRISPFFYSLMLTGLTFLVTYTWKKENYPAYLAAAVMILVSNFGYVMALVFPDQQYFLWDALFWVQPQLTHLINPATSSSYIFFLGGCWCLLKWLQTGEKGQLLLMGLIWGILPGFKIYPGLLVLAALLTGGLYIVISQRRFSVMAAFGAVVPVQLVISLPSLASNQKLIHFMPGYNLGTMLVSPDRLNLLSSQALKQLYVDQPMLVAGIMAGLMVVFVIGNLGPRIIALPTMVNALFRPRKADPFILFSTILCGGALIAATCFIQTGLKWNTIQFFYYAIVLTTIISSVQCWQWIGSVKKEWQMVLVSLFIVIGLPGTFQAIKVINWKTTVGQNVIEAMQWIEKQEPKGEAKVLRPLPDNLKSDDGFNRWLQELDRGKLTSIKNIKEDARTVVAEVRSSSISAVAFTKLEESATSLERIDTATVASLTLNNSYLEDLRRAAIMGYPVVARAKKVTYFYKEANVVEAREFLEHEKIKYVILYAENTLPFKPEGVPLKQVFKNQEVTIYKYINPGGW